MASATTSSAGGERRQLTVMFCDIVGYTELAQRVDPEELREIVAAYQSACVRPVTQFGGHVAQYLGDGILVYFGFPLAQEDAAERALRAALAIRASLAELNQRRSYAGAEEIAARIGIHTGQVVVTEVGADSHQETLAVGDAVNVAARLQAIAEPGAIHVSQATLRLVPGLFLTSDLGTPPLKGVAEPISVHTLEGTRGIGTRFRGRGSRTPLCGRNAELAHLLACWNEAVEGLGQVVLISGEAGIGKSRLLHSVPERLEESRHFALEIGCSPYTQDSAFQPLIELLERVLGFLADDPPALRLEKLEDRLAELPGLDLSQVVPYLASPLGLPESKRYPLTYIGPELQRELTLEALLAPIVAIAKQLPLLVLCEDLHWCDPSTLEWLGLLIERAAKLPLLVLATFRPGFAIPWKPRPGVSSLALQRLSRESTLEVVRSCVELRSGLSGDVLELLAERADGVPLFAEELTRSVLESETAADTGTAPSVSHTTQIPSTLQDSLMARLDRLGSGKQVAQVAAALGRTFGYALIEAVSELDEAALHGGLARLVEAEILFQSGIPPHSSYIFKHALLQDTAYESQLKSRRRELHARIARVLRERFPERAAAEPELTARHCAAGGLISEAIDGYRQAGEHAAARLAYQEAQSYFAQALDLLATLPEDAARQGKEIDLRLAQAAPLGALHGYENPEFKASIARVDELIAAIGTGPQQIPGLLRLAMLHTNQLARAHHYADALLGAVEGLDIAPLEMAGRILRGTGAIVCATVPEACADLQRALEIAEAIELPTPKAAFEIDALAMGCSTYAIALVLAGRPDTARALVERGVRRARELAHPRTQASALQIGATAFHLADDAGRAGELSKECIELIEGRGFHQVEVSARVLAAWARARQGDPSATTEIDDALRRAEERGVVAGMPQLYFAAAETHMLAREHARALEQVARGEQFMERSGEELRYEPHARLTRARVLLDAGTDLDQAESLLERALALWAMTQSPWMQLSAAIFLGRLALATGKRVDEAGERLARLYQGFEEGFETSRLRDAHAVLDRLGRSPSDLTA